MLAKNSCHKTEILREFHSSLYGGHMGVEHIRESNLSYGGREWSLIVRGLLKNAWFANKLKFLLRNIRVVNAVASP